MSGWVHLRDPYQDHAPICGAGSEHRAYGGSRQTTDDGDRVDCLRCLVHGLRAGLLSAEQVIEGIMDRDAGIGP